MDDSLDISIVIPTFGRDEVLRDTVAHLLALAEPADEIIVVDQTTEHSRPVRELLAGWHEAGAVRWLLHAPPGTVGAMNRGLQEARGHIVLFLDDDLIPGAALVEAHRASHAAHPEAWAVVGQVLQPEDMAEGATATGPPRQVGAGPARAATLRQDLDFRFNGDTPAWVTNVMAGNLSVKRDRALALGGFDGNFTPPVSYRFETEFAKRLVVAGGRIRFEPRASIRHLRAPRGGTRSRGSHLDSASPVHGVGDYYYALRCGHGWDRLLYLLRRPFREVRTRFHLRHPWYIPVKLVGELRALRLALRLYRQGPRLARCGDEAREAMRRGRR